MKRVLSLVLAMIFCLSLLPFGALADGEIEEAPAEAVEAVEELPAEDTIPAEEPEPEPEPEPAEEPAEAPAEEAPVEEPPAEPEEAPALDGAGSSGSCGANLTWSLSLSGVLTITGDGDMYDYNNLNDRTRTPWYGSAALITEVVLPEGLTRIGNMAFDQCTAMSSINLPASLGSVGSSAFLGCTALTSITFTGSAPTIASNAFTGCTLTAYYPALDASWTEAVRQNYGGTITWMYRELASGTCGNSLNWRLTEDGVLTITGTGAMTNYSTVTPWDSYCAQITSVVLPAGITTIGGSAFSKCSELTRIDLPEGIKKIGKSAFENCTGLTEITIPSSVTSIGNAAFSGCTGLTEITFLGAAPAFGNTAFTGVAATAYYPGDDDSWTEDVRQNYGGTITWVAKAAANQCGDNVFWSLEGGVLTISGTGPMWDYPVDDPSYSAYLNEITSVVIESGVTGIGSFAFYDLSAMTKITIPAGVTSIGEGAFKNCSRLKSVAIPDSVTSLGFGVFYDCRGLTAITFAGAAPTFGGSVFNNVTATAYYPADDASWTEAVRQNYSGTITWVAAAASGQCGDNVYWALTDGGELIVCGAGPMWDFPEDWPTYYDLRSGITSVVIESGVTAVGEYAFFSLNAMTKITIPAGVTSIGKTAFGQCSSLREITFLGSAPTFGNSVFYDVTAAAYYPGSDASWTEDVRQNYGGTITWVAEVASGQCGDDVYWVLADGGVLTISGTGAMWDYSSTNPTYYEYRSAIMSVVLESGVTSIGEFAFYDLGAMTEITIPAGVTGIGQGAFRDCSKLESVTIPDSVTSIGFSAFDRCGSLTEITFLGAAPTFGSNVFYNVIAIAFYPAGDASWTEAVRQNYGGTITWVADAPSGQCGDDVYWTLVGGVLTITGTGPMWDYSTEYPPYHAYQAEITSLVIASGVTGIGVYAFYGLTALTSASIPESVTNIAYGAFAYCSSLMSVTIPASVTSIGEYAFYKCESLTEITFAGSAPTFGENVFKSVTAIAYYPAGDASWTAEVRKNYGGTITWLPAGSAANQCGDDVFWSLEDGVLTISGTGAMWDYDTDHPGYYSLRDDILSVVIGSGVTAIGVGAFFNLTAMTSVAIPSGVASIGAGAFYFCDSLTEITFAGSAPTFGSNVFKSVTATAYYPGSDTSWTEDVRQNYGGVITWVADNPSGQCGDDVFWTLENGVLTITGTGPMWDYTSGFPTFYSLSDSITSVVIESGVTEIGAEAFYYLTAMASVTIPAGVTSIGSRAFYNCESLTEITFAGSAPTFGNYVFTYVTATAYYPAGDASWTADVRQDYGGTITWTPVGELPTSGQCGDDVFWTLEDGVLTITGTGPMWDYSSDYPTYYDLRGSITSVVIESGVTEIGAEAFYYLTAMASVTIPAGVTSIGSRAFYNCESLTEITFAGSAPTFGNYVFTYVTATAYHPAGDASWTAEVRQNYGGAITWVAYDPVLDVTFSHSTSLGNNLSIIYYIPTSYLEGCDNVRLHVEKNKYNTDGTYTVSEYDITNYTVETKNGVERFRFAFSNIAAKEIGDDVRATVRAEKDGITRESEVDVYSVKTYAMSQLGKTGNAKLRTLLVDLLNYGAQAQVYFNYNTANLANADLTAEQQAYGTAELGELTSCESTTETPGATARFSSKSVVLGNEIVIKYYMKFDEGQSLDNVRAEFTYTTSVGTPTTVSFAASEFDYDSANDRYTVRLHTIAAKDAGQPVTARIYDGDTLISEVLTYSIETYAYNQLGKESLGANARAIITAMMKFCKSAEAYF